MSKEEFQSSRYLLMSGRVGAPNENECKLIGAFYDLGEAKDTAAADEALQHEGWHIVDGETGATLTDDGRIILYSEPA